MIAEFDATARNEAGGGRREAAETRLPPPASSVAIVTDSTADLDPAVAAAAGITVVPAAIRLGDGAIQDRGGLPIDPADDPGPDSLEEEFDLARTTDAFAATWRTLLADRDAVVAVLLSGRLGDAVSAARAARDSLPEPARVTIVDSRSASLGLGLQVLRAAELARSGGGPESIADAIEAARDRYHVVFSVESAAHLRRSGQIGRSAALIAEMLQLKPLLRIDEGQIVPYERARTRAGAIAELVAFVGQLPAVERVVVLYASEPEDAGRLAHAIEAGSGVPPAHLSIARIGPAVAAHVGPGALGLAVVEGEE
jgi:DegV family protein with EDD domain